MPGRPSRAVTSAVESTTEIAYDTTPWDAGTLAKVSATLNMRDIAYTFADGELVVDKLDELRAEPSSPTSPPKPSTTYRPHFCHRHRARHPSEAARPSASDTTTTTTTRSP
jgi:hypothetical protein